MTLDDASEALDIIKTANDAIINAMTRFGDTPENRLALASLMVTNGINLFAATMGIEKTRLLVSDMLADLDKEQPNAE